MSEPLGIVQDAGFSDTLALLEVRRPGETYFLGIWASPRGPRVFRASREDKRAAFQGKLPGGYAAHAVPPGIVGAHVVRITPMEVALLAKAPSGGVATAIVVQKRRVTTVGLDTVDLAGEASLPGLDHRALAELAHAGLDAHKTDARSVLLRAAQRIERRIEGVARDIVEMGRAEGLIAQAQWLVASAAKAKRGQSTLAYTEWTETGPIERELPLDPAKSPKAQVDAMFHRARRLKAGRAFAEKRKLACIAARDGVLAYLDRIQEATELTAIDDLLARAKHAWPKEVVLGGSVQQSVARSRSGRGKPERVPFRTYTTDRGERILVGRTDRDNDALTFQVARPHDLFLHVRGEPGSHVIVPLAKNQPPPPDLLVDAAHLAAHFSRVKDEDRVEVEYTPKKWVRKQKGSAAGAVWYERVSVLALAVDRERTRGLLERETS